MKKGNLLLIGLIAIVVIIFVYVTGDFGTRVANNKINKPLIGGQKDEHGCIIPAGYSWCEPKQKCLRIWEERCYGEDEEAIKTIFAAETKKPLATITVTIMQEINDQARGSVIFGKTGEAEGGEFLAVKKDGQWQLVFSGNGAADCQNLKKDFSPDLLTGLCD